VLRYLGSPAVKIIPRGAGTSLSGGALPSEDAVVAGLARLNRILRDRLRHSHRAVEAASPTSTYQRGQPRGSSIARFLPSSQPPDHRGNIAMNSAARIA